MHFSLPSLQPRSDHNLGAEASFTLFFFILKFGKCHQFSVGQSFHSKVTALNLQICREILNSCSCWIPCYISWGSKTIYQLFQRTETGCFSSRGFKWSLTRNIHLKPNDEQKHYSVKRVIFAAGLSTLAATIFNHTLLNLIVTSCNKFFTVPWNAWQ